MVLLLTRTAPLAMVPSLARTATGVAATVLLLVHAAPEPGPLNSENVWSRMVNHGHCRLQVVRIHISGRLADDHHNVLNGCLAPYAVHHRCRISTDVGNRSVTPAYGYSGGVIRYTATYKSPLVCVCS